MVDDKMKVGMMMRRKKRAGKEGVEHEQQQQMISMKMTRMKRTQGLEKAVDEVRLKRGQRPMKVEKQQQQENKQERLLYLSSLVASLWSGCFCSCCWFCDGSI